MTLPIKEIHLTDLMSNRVFISPPDLPKEQIFGKLIKLICQAEPRLDFAEIVKKILAREAELSTTLDCGLSLPHVRLDGIDRAWAAVGVLPQALRDRNGYYMKAVFLFITPLRSEFFQTHLHILSSAVELFSPAFMEKLSHCRDAEMASQMLAHADSTREMI